VPIEDDWNGIKNGVGPYLSVILPRAVGQILRRLLGLSNISGLDVILEVEL
jgi:hypothetical protein|tara:strand:+ start:1263 stop:1415 length:153 start_codon:yes stop_codon:yes gene_type:complete